MKIFFSAGEPSGDTHAANLIRQLRQAQPDIECVGFGGPQMRAAGCDLHFELTQLAVMGFSRVIPLLPKFWNLAGQASRYFRHRRPDAVVLVDFPGFNWWIARRAKACGIPVFYYAPPQIWAWARWRVAKMRRLVDHVLCALPFEQTWFSEHGCHATFVGHPFFDEVRQHALDQSFMDEHRSCPAPIPTRSASEEPSADTAPTLTRSVSEEPSANTAATLTRSASEESSADTAPILTRSVSEDSSANTAPTLTRSVSEGPTAGETGAECSSLTRRASMEPTSGEDAGPIVTILPGSRTQEVVRNLKWFLKAAQYVRDRVPNVRFMIASFKPQQAEIARKLVEQMGVPAEIHVGKTPELIRLATCCMAVSGSVSLELLYHAKPTVILYHVDPFMYWVQGFCRKVKYITLVNLLSVENPFPRDITPYHPGQPDADRVLFPEYLTCEDKSGPIASHIVEWLTHPVLYARRVASLAELRDRVSAGGASHTAAQYILAALEPGPRSFARPHFVPSRDARVV